MAETAAVPISKVDGVTPTDDGQFALIKTTLPDGAELVLAIPTDQISGLVDLAAAGRVQAQKKQNGDPNIREVHNTTWWELGRDPTSGLLVLSLTFGAGGRLDFGLPNPMPAQILETLQVMTGVSTPLAPGIRTN